MSARTDYVIYFGAVICICGVAVVQIAAPSVRKRREVLGVFIGSFVVGAIGFVASSVIALLAGFVPFLGTPGNPTAMAAVIFAGTALFAWPGAMFGKLWARHSLPRSRWPY